MAKRNQKKQFSPHIYAEWGELFEYLTVEQRADILMAITKFPCYEPKDNPIWAFIKSQLQKDYEIFIDKCEKNAEISREYWSKKKSNDTERIPNGYRTIPNDAERHPKLITNNELLITNNELQITNNNIDKKLKEKEIKMLQCNIDVTKSNDNKDKEKNKQKQENNKKEYGEFKNVKLDDVELAKLKDLYGIKLNEAIECLSSYIKSSGKRYKDFYAVLNKHNWVYKKIFSDSNKNNTFQWSV